MCSEVLQNDIYHGVLSFEVPREKMIHDAWRYFLRIFCIIVALGVVFILLGVLSWIDSSYEYYCFVGGAALMIPYGIIYALVLRRKQRWCPHIIKRNGDFLFFDDMTFSARKIDKLIMTDPNSYQSSVEVNHRYITIFSEGKKYRYWFGIYGSLTVEQYKNLCDVVEQAFVMYPSKIIYKK